MIPLFFLALLQTPAPTPAAPRPPAPEAQQPAPKTSPPDAFLAQGALVIAIHLYCYNERNRNWDRCREVKGYLASLAGKSRRIALCQLDTASGRCLFSGELVVVQSRP